MGEHMWEAIKELVNRGETQKAREEIRVSVQNGQYDDILAVLLASACEQDKDGEGMFLAIAEGLSYNCRNYELYFLLGDYYLSFVGNCNQAFLSYEQAFFFCNRQIQMEKIQGEQGNAGDNLTQEDAALIYGVLQELRSRPECTVKNVSIVIPSYNVASCMKDAITSIKKTMLPGTYEIIVVDNASTDGIREWLQEQTDLICVFHDNNEGFPKACNEGIRQAAPDHDIFLLNNDTILTENALYQLRMGLYARDNIGASGAVSNHVGNDQQVTEKCDNVKEYLAFGERNNIPMLQPLEKKIWLVGFALLCKREALCQVGLLDERFSPGNYEDDDLGVRMQLAGYEMVLCHNSFIFHYGSRNFNKNIESYARLSHCNRHKFKEKWNFDIQYYTYARIELIQMIQREKRDEFSVLEVGCGMGTTLSRIRYEYPYADVYGIEINAEVARIGSQMARIQQGDIETMDLDYEGQQFDYIIFADVLEHLREPEKTIQKLLPYLKVGGHILTSIPNMMHASVILPLLKGNFTYEDSGILDRTHLRFFTGMEIMKLFTKNQLKVTNFIGMSGEKKIFEQEKEMYEALLKLPGVADREFFEAYQFLVDAMKIKQ